MELGVAATTVGQVPRERIATLRALMEETVPLVSEGRFVDVEAYTRHNEAFHNAIVDLADNPTLADAYRRLGVAGLMVSLLREGSEAGAGDHRRPPGHRRRLRAGQPARRRRRDQTAQREREGDHPAGDRRCWWRPLTAAGIRIHHYLMRTSSIEESAWQTAPTRSARSSERPRWT